MNIISAEDQKWYAKDLSCCSRKVKPVNCNWRIGTLFGHVVSKERTGILHRLQRAESEVEVPENIYTEAKQLAAGSATCRCQMLIDLPSSNVRPDNETRSQLWVLIGHQDAPLRPEYAVRSLC